MGESPSGKREPNLELPPLRLPGFRRKKVRRTAPAEPEPSLEPSPEQHEPAEHEPAQHEPAQHEPAEHEPAPRKPRRRTRQRRTRQRRTRPVVPGPLAALVTGLVVGAVGTGLTYGGMLGCQAVNGTPSCGEPGLGFLVAIAAIMVALGAMLLRLLRVPEPVGASFLALGILAMVLLIGLTSVIFSVWMFLVIPLVTAAAYLAAHWVTTRLVDAGERPPGPDVR